MKWYSTKIGRIINEEFDSRMRDVVFSYIMDKGISNVKGITDKQIAKLEGNGLMTANFVQSLVRCARRICNECEWNEMIEFIRLFLWCTPTVHDVCLYREDFSEDSFADLLDNLNLYNKEVEDVIKLFIVVDEDYLKESD